MGTGIYPRKSPAERFWSYVAKSDGCWNWIGHKSEKGYGLLAVDKKPTRAHRLSWTMHQGRIPEGMQVLHRCDNPSCVRPDHLFLGDNKANHDDKIAKSRQGAARGEAGAWARLTEQEVRDIRASSKGRTSSEKRLTLARRYGISLSHLDAIRCRRKWAHLE